MNNIYITQRPFYVGGRKESSAPVCCHSQFNALCFQKHNSFNFALLFSDTKDVIVSLMKERARRKGEREREDSVGISRKKAPKKKRSFLAVDQRTNRKKMRPQLGRILESFFKIYFFVINILSRSMKIAMSFSFVAELSCIERDDC